MTKTREQWLVAATAKLAPMFTGAGATLPPVRVSVGWPSGRSAKANTIGQCWYTVADGQPALFISPALTDPITILATLVHELTHAAVGPSPQAHRGKFVSIAKAVGLDGPWTATTANPELQKTLAKLAEKLGPFEHSQVNKGTGRPKPQTTRMLKVVCLIDGYTVRTTAKWLNEMGFPTCPCGSEMDLA